MKIMINFIVATFLISTSTGAKRLDLTLKSGQEIKTFTSPGGVVEHCYIPKKFPLAKYKGSNIVGDLSGDYDDERDLCSMDFYGELAVCPKLSSTNPGLEIYEMEDGMTAPEWEAVNCTKGSKNRDKKTSSKEAKFKQSVTCSYTPSALAYYHMGRTLEAGNIPVAVLRSMDLDEHKTLAKSAYETAVKLGMSSMKSSWKILNDLNSNASRSNYGGRSDNTDKVYTTDSKQIFGALSENPSRESYHSELNGPSSPKGYSNRYKRFVKSATFLSMNSSSSKESLHTSKNGSDVQKVQYLKDLSDMILLDYILNQQDRPGNIEMKTYKYEIQDDGTFDRSKLSKKNKDKHRADFSSEELEILQNQGTYIVDEMILKDNDCGVKKTNYTQRTRPDGSTNGSEYKDGGLLSAVRHMSPKTYKNFMALAKSVDSDESEKFFKEELHFDQEDYSGSRHSWYGGFKNMVKAAQKILTDACKSGKLKLDLDPLAAMHGKKAESVACE